MENIATITIQDKDIKNLIPQLRQYKKVVNNPKEFYIFINPKGTKTFSLKFDSKFIKIGERQESIFTVAIAQTKTMQILKKLNSGKQNIDELRGKKKDAYIYENLFYKIIEHK
ncbi:hypothetical protein [Campylobacter suis]|uniref:DUF4102 domain-containing protein n=1 Tax=Campylobacter suis TaxID=2790657 RepID=A0ABM8Q8Q7_9BACT|nr:hypothetical protein [Campylobacter suis]CAD7289286.1 hypothetical protein LMG8286_01733 [Campylobacter suis]